MKHRETCPAQTGNPWQSRTSRKLTVTVSLHSFYKHDNSIRTCCVVVIPLQYAYGSALHDVVENFYTSMALDSKSNVHKHKRENVQLSNVSVLLSGCHPLSMSVIGFQE